MLYRCRGVVLRTYRLGEADRIVVLATDEHGKVRAVAKGVRKTKSRLGARLEPTSHVSLLLYQGRGELDIVSQAESVDLFSAMRRDLERLNHANAMLEIIDLTMQERQRDPKLYAMLVGALRELERTDSPLLVPAFGWKVLAHEGYHPSLQECVRCGAADDPPGTLVGFDAAAGGTTCRACTLGPALVPGALALLRRVLGGGLAGALREPPTAATHDVERLATLSLETVLERRLKVGRM